VISFENHKKIFPPVYGYTGENPKIVIAGALPTGDGACLTLKTTRLLRMFYHVIFVCSASKGVLVNRRQPPKFGER